MAFIITVLTVILIIVVAAVIIKFILSKTEAEINVLPPEAAKVGEEVSYTMTIKNTGAGPPKKFGAGFPMLFFFFAGKQFINSNLWAGFFICLKN